MSLFRGSAISSRAGSHYFYSEQFQAHGLAVFALDDFEAFVDANALPKSLQRIIRSLAGNESLSEPDILHIFQEYEYTNFYYEPIQTDGGFGEKIYKSNTQVRELCKHADKDTKTRNSSTPVINRNLEKTIQQINNSKNGCLLSNKVDNGETLSSLRLYFQKPGEDQKARMPSLKETTMFAAVPRRKSGAKYSYKHSHDAGVGVYVGNAQGNSPNDEDFSSFVSAPLKLIYNHNQGVFECSSTYLAIMLEGLDGADVVNHSTTNADLAGLRSEDYYANKAINYMSEFTTGLAMPCSLQDNNPYHFGPNIIKANDEERGEKVRVVNRTTQTFDKGELVLIHQIDGENILIKIATGSPPVERPPAFGGPWSFSKFLANSDSYFRDSRGERILPGLDASKRAVDLWYQSTRGGVGKFKVLYQDHISHQMNKNSGHPHKHAFGDRINVAIGLGDNDVTENDGVLYTDIPMFWGPVYSQGANAKDTRFANQFQIPAEIHMEGDPELGASPVENCQRTLYDFNIEDWQVRVKAIEDIRFNTPDPRDGVEVGSFQPRKYLTGYKEGKTPNKPVSDTSVQFSLLSADLYGHMDQNSGLVEEANMGGSRNQMKAARDFYKTAAQYAKVPQGTKLFRESYDWGGIHGTREMNDSFADVFKVKAGGYNGPPYAKYVERLPLDVGSDTLLMFGNDSDSSTRKWSSALGYGIIAGRRKMSKLGGGWTLNVETDQVFGLQGEFFGGGGGGGGISTFAVGPFAFQSDTRGRVIAGTDQAWGSSLDSAYSANTAALHVQIWDGWPDEDTVWLGQLFSLVHFNPGRYASSATTSIVKKTNFPGTDNEVEVDVTREIAEYRVDFPEPTYGALDENGEALWLAGADGREIPDDAVVTAKTVVRPKNLWKINTSSRGRPVTYYGYTNARKYIGLDPSTIQFTSRGTGFKENDIIKINEELQFKITSIQEGGAIATMSFADDEDLNQSFYTPAVNEGETGTKINNKYQGDYSSEFAAGPVVITLPSPDGGESAECTFTQGKVYTRKVWDYGPKTRSGMIRCSKPSTNGQRRVTGTRATQVAVTTNESGTTPLDVSPYPGTYELLTHCHNDIGLALHSEPHSTAGYQMHNFITVRIT